jgi:uncharacterized protein YeaC (DUF1315 family)
LAIDRTNTIIRPIVCTGRVYQYLMFEYVIAVITGKWPYGEGNTLIQSARHQLTLFGVDYMNDIEELQLIMHAY